MSDVVFAACYLIVYAAGGWALRNHALWHSLFGNVGLVVPPLLACAIILRRRRHWEGSQRLFWDTFAIGVSLWVIGHLGWAFDEMVLGRRAWLHWHTVFTLCGGIGPLIALLARPHLGVRREAVGTVLLDLASYGLLAVFIYSYFVLVPGVVESPREGELRLLTVVQVNRAVLFAAMLVAARVARRTPWKSTYEYLALGTGIGFVLRIVTSLAIVRGDYQSGTLYDLAWIAPFLCYARAAIAAPDSPAGFPGVELQAPATPAWVSAVPVFLIPLIGYGALLIPLGQPLGGAADSFRALLTGLMTVAGVGLLTVRLAAQGGELQRADARIRLLAAATEQIAEMILITRASGAFEHANDAFVRAMGYSRQELSRLTLPDLMAPESGEVPVEAEVRQRGIWSGRLMRRRRDGSTFPAASTIVGLKDATGSITHLVGVERDITDELKHRAQLVHSERLAAVGELVAGVAHEINNPLQTILGSVELMLEDSTDPAQRTDLELVRSQATRAGQIVRNLLSFVRRTTTGRLPGDLNEIVMATLDLRRHHLAHVNVALGVHLHAGELPVLVNREEIQQVVLNLLLNAEQAILSAGKAGRITIRTRGSDGRQVLEIADNGPGVSPDLQGRIFEPFFTTKDVGEGTGLGLSISHGIAAAHGGSLEHCSGHEGACFELALPAHARTAPMSSEASSQQSRSTSRASYS